MADKPGVTPNLPPQESSWNEQADAIDAKYDSDPNFSTFDWGRNWNDEDGTL